MMTLAALILAASAVVRVEIPSSADGTLQPSYFAAPETKEKVPLLVVLHTWSYSCENRDGVTEKWCADKGWACLYPNFRGPNRTPDACGSDKAVQDIVDAVAWAKKQVAVDEDRVYLLGGSGGGHMSLLMAGRHPEIWAAVSAWCPISDLARWHRESALLRTGYDSQMARACGGTPDEVPDVYRHRSPVTWLPNAKGKVILNIATGIHDGHTGSVPVGHSLRAFNCVAEGKDCISEGDIFLTEWNQALPPRLAKETPGADPYCGKSKVHFQRRSATASVTLFEGGHNIYYATAPAWLERQVRGRSPVWSVTTAASSCASELSK